MNLIKSFVQFILIFLGALVFQSVPVMAQDSENSARNLQVNGEVSAVFNFHERPTAIQNNFDFDVPSLGISFENETGIGEGDRYFWHLGISNIGDPHRDPDTGARALSFSSATIQVYEGGTQNYLMAGLISSPILDFEDESWSGGSLGDDYAGLFNRSELFNGSDYGAQIVLEPEGHYYSTGLGIQNGEGASKDESGPGKDWIFWINLNSPDQKFKSQFFYQAGRYAGLPLEKSERNRGGFNLGYYGESTSMVLSGVDARDAVDGVLGKYWDGANLNSRSGMISNSQAALVRLSFRQAKYQLHLQALSADPDLKIKKNSLQSYLVALEKDLGEGQSLWLAKAETRFEPNHSPGIDNKSNWVLGLLLNF